MHFCLGHTIELSQTIPKSVPLPLQQNATSVEAEIYISLIIVVVAKFAHFIVSILVTGRESFPINLLTYLLQH